MWELWGVEISAFPLTWHIAYTTACCYPSIATNFRQMDGQTDKIAMSKTRYSSSCFCA